MISYYHKYIAYIGMMLCHYSFYIACKKDPGVISAQNIDCFNHQEYDNVLYLKGFGCRTCRTIKVRKVLLEKKCYA